MLAYDFFHVDCAVTLQRIYVFFVIEINTRYVHILGTTTTATDPGPPNRRNLITDLGDRAELRFLARDRAGQFTANFDTVFRRRQHPRREDPAPLPQASGYAERFVRTVRAELTDRMLIFGQRYLRRVLGKYVTHYNQQTARPRPSPSTPSPPEPAPTDAPAPVIRQPFLGGLISEYYPAA